MRPALPETAPELRRRSSERACDLVTTTTTNTNNNLDERPGLTFPFRGVGDCVTGLCWGRTGVATSCGVVQTMPGRVRLLKILPQVTTVTCRQ